MSGFPKITTPKYDYPWADKYPVTEDDLPPASTGPECFWCGQPVGEFHHPECSRITKTVKVRAIVEYDIEVPAHWDKDRVESSRNGGTWCAMNLLGELGNLDDCLCGRTRFEFVSEGEMIGPGEEA